MAKRITIKSANKNQTAAIPAPRRAKTTSATWVFWGALCLFIGVVIWSLSTFDKPLRDAEKNADTAAVQPADTNQNIASTVVVNDMGELEQIESIAVVDEYVEEGAVPQNTITPEIDSSTAVVANAVVLSDEQKEVAARDFIMNGMEMLNAGKPDLALSEFNSAIALFPSFAPSYIYRGEALFQKTDYAGALDSFNNAIALDENNALAWFDKAILLARLGDFETALASANFAIEAYEKAPDANSNVDSDELFRKRAEFNLALTNWSDAIRDYTMASGFATNLDKINFGDIAGRADAKVGLGDLEGALQDYSLVIENVSTNIQNVAEPEGKADAAVIAMKAFEKRGAIKLKLGDLTGAREDIQGAIVLADAIGDADTKAALQSALSQI